MATTRPGGAYIVNGVLVDSEGRPIAPPKPKPKGTR